MEESRPAGERNIERRAPGPIPESPNVTEVKARIERDRALTGLFDKLSTLAELGRQVLQELLQEAAEERRERAERQARRGGQ